MLILSVVGVALVAFGLLVLLKFPDRPGGKVALGKAEVSSTGAGLPLVVVGVVCLVLGVRGARGTDDDGNLNFNSANSNGATATPSATTPTPSPPPADARARDECLAAREALSQPGAAQRPPAAPQPVGDEVKSITVGLGSRERRVWTGGRVPDELRVHLLEGGRFAGVVRLGLEATGDESNPQFRVRAVFDGECRAVSDYENGIEGSDPNLIINWGSLVFRMNGAAYKARFGFPGDGSFQVAYFVKL
jgi:hypothetical protein